MIICPHCAHQEMEGALFCSQCGGDLLSSDGLPTSDITHIPAESSPPRPILTEAPEESPPYSIHQLILRIHQEDKTIPVQSGMEITLGRVSPKQSILPDIDLSPFGAYEAGVSRIHAKLCMAQSEISLIDLGSANGTWVNGKKIPARTAYRLNHNDEICLGKLKFHILFK